MLTKEIDGKKYILIERGEDAAKACDVCAGQKDGEDGRKLCLSLGYECMGNMLSWKEQA